jgi:hypothetical protein
VIAVGLTPVLPAGLPLLAALGGLGTRWTGWRRLLGRQGRGHGDGRPASADAGAAGAESLLAEAGRPEAGRGAAAGAEPKELSAGGKR